MEYPMMAMEAKGENGPDLYNVITHEIGHMWFPMTVGSDERRYAWMDEGFNTFMNTFSEEDYWKRDDTEIRRGEARFVTALDQTPNAQPIMTPANRYKDNENLGSLAYVKPSIMLLALRNKVLGPEVFDTAFREYTRRWAFKHPQPADFFRTIDQVSGRDLSWFWRGFFYTTAALDQSVETVRQTPDSGAEVVVRSLGAAVMPVELRVGYADGSSDLIKLPVEIWYAGNRYLYRYNPGKQIVSARVNPDGAFPDVVPANDGWASAPARSTP
jgi:aminopeptidase N